MTRYLAVPNFCGVEHRSSLAEAAIGQGVSLRSIHADPDHNRTVLMLESRDPRALLDGVIRAAGAAVASTDLREHAGVHPHVGVIDVAPIVYLEEADRGIAHAAALTLGDRLGSELGVPVLLYGTLAGGRTRAELRRGGPAALAARITSGELHPDFGPSAVDARVGVTLVAARPPMIAFNAELAAPATIDDARRIAAAIREGGPEGLPAVRALGLWLAASGTAQVSMNLEDWRRTSPWQAVQAIARHAEVARCELVAPAPRGAFDDFPQPNIRVANFNAMEAL